MVEQESKRGLEINRRRGISSALAIYFIVFGMGGLYTFHRTNKYLESEKGKYLDKKIENYITNNPGTNAYTPKR